ncbi:unnamed protein product [Caenorhabditis nigoni]
MSGEAIEYESLTYAISDESKIFGTSVTNGIKCSWSGALFFDDDGDTDYIELEWKIDWLELKNEGFDRLTGFLTVMPQDDGFDERRIEIDWKETTKTITERIFVDYDDYDLDDEVLASYKFSLVPHYAVPITNVCYDEILAASELNDTVLLIDGKKAHVNRAFLSYHSEFLRALFSANFKEGAMNEIPIEEVSYEDFGLLMSIIHPKTSFPNDATVQKLLELADRFMMPFVIGHVEHHLLNNSKISNEKMIWMADSYGMPTLLEKTINELNTLEMAKKLKKSPGFQKLSKDARSSILGKIMELI